MNLLFSRETMTQVDDIIKGATGALINLKSPDYISYNTFKESMGLMAFFRRAYPDIQKVPVVYTFYGNVGGVEVKYIRYQLDETSYTFVLEMSRYCDFFIDELSQETSEAWADKVNQCTEMAKCGYKRNVTKLPIEFSLVSIQGAEGAPQEPHIMDDLMDGDLGSLAHALEQFPIDFRERIGKVTTLAIHLGALMASYRDHDLYLSFKATNQFTELNVGLDRVYPLLPEGGEYELGNTPINLEDWENYGKKVYVLAKRISHAGNQINRMINAYRKLLPGHPYVQASFADMLKVQLMASSHFMKKIYGFSRVDGREMVEKVANEMIEKLTAVGGNIGLDLNSWIVYDYDVEGRPQQLVNENLNFLKLLYECYTTDFIEALYAHLISLHNPYIRPYTYREVVSGDDGIEIGSIRQVK